MPPSFIDLSGQTLGCWTVLYRMPGGRGARWFCRCLCGTEKSVEGGHLRSGKTKSCGCISQPSFIDLSGQSFHRWTVLYQVAIPREKGAHWLCRCSCGVERVVLSSSLRCGVSRSCGCLSREVSSTANRIDITGQRFGRAVALIAVGSTRQRDVLWKCACDCGSEFTTSTKRLINKKTKSCGCRQLETIFQVVDITGRQSGLLRAIERGPDAANGRVRWWCECECGNRALRLSSSICRGKVISCGCANRRTSSTPPLLPAAIRLEASVHSHNRRTRKSGG